MKAHFVTLPGDGVGPEVTAAAGVLTFPLYFGSTAFMPHDLLPNWLQWFNTFNPVNYLITADRALMSSHWDWHAIGGALLTAKWSTASVFIAAAGAALCAALAAFCLSRLAGMGGTGKDAVEPATFEAGLHPSTTAGA